MIQKEDRTYFLEKNRFQIRKKKPVRITVSVTILNKKKDMLLKNSGTRIMQAGAIVFRVLNNRHEVLLILSKKKPQIRIFPKGHIEVGESSEEAALRELIEEAGIRGRSIGIAGGIEQEWDGKLFTITYHIFNFAETVSKGEDGRDPSWFSIADAYERLSSTELKNLLINTKRQFEIES